MTLTRVETSITVNRKPVVVSGHEPTGLTVLEAAVAYGVQVELDFQLAEVRHGKRHIVGRDDVVRVVEGSEFFATAPDDNS